MLPHQATFYKRDHLISWVYTINHILLPVIMNLILEFLNYLHQHTASRVDGISNNKKFKQLRKRESQDKI